MRIRPCIDLHGGKVKQIVGGTLCDGEAGRPGAVQENYVSAHGASYYAALYREKKLSGGHVILLDAAEKSPERYEADRREAFAALAAYPGGMQAGGGITAETAEDFLAAGASHVIVTSYVFRGGRLDERRLGEMQRAAGRERLVLDLSCRRQQDGSYLVMTERWQRPTELVVGPELLDQLSAECGEFLIHAVDAEGKRAGAELAVTELLGGWQRERERSGKPAFPVTYAGGIRSAEDIAEIRRRGGEGLDVTVGSALSLFGGSLSLEELAAACTAAL
ncbi:phosphoribosylformimino-5-aminoimidazole carboxamide ribotide isomerase [Lachnoclostridium sp. Marseille-P6806]|uniref:phosphoribosylformimino-5-aminoimidazole carboxamide ribotide isomerase n=1 Tax=Lachnoclostridium sp. Marseille-P6806 TaxID=2364793 RepID=UPI001031CBCD|nr:phosphoribosylformimino-5-aminoimidazole carboxamide ribotide isomerase [Lachnoclostridium sp. Marseille-P6806]